MADSFRNGSLIGSLDLFKNVDLFSNETMLRIAQNGTTVLLCLCFELFLFEKLSKTILTILCPKCYKLLTSC